MTHFARRDRRRRSNAARNVPHSGASAVDAKAPPVTMLFDDLADEAQLVFEHTASRRRVRGVPVYGQYPRALIAAMLPWLACERREVLHVCSGALPPGEGIRVDIRPEAQPDFVADGRKLPFADGSHAAVMLDPPYSEHYSKELYGVKYPRPSHLLREAARVVRPGGRIIIVHYITPKPVAGTTFVKAWGLSTGFDMPIRAVTCFQRDGGQLALGGST